MCLWTAKKSVDACLFAPNESPILRILGMNNRNKITFKMLHLTVEAWRLQRLQSFPQLTSHTCTGPARFTQEAHGASIGRDTIPLENMDLYSAPGPIHACAPAVLSAGAALRCQDRPDLQNFGVHGRMLRLWGILFYFLPSCFFF